MCLQEQFVVPRGENLTYKMVTQGWGNWHLKTWKCQISLVLPNPPILGQTIDKCIMQSKSTFLEFLRGIHRYKFGHPKKFFRGEIIQGEWRNFHRARALFLTGVEFHVLPCVLVYFLVEFDLLFAFSELCFLVYLCPRTRSPMLSDVNRGNSCIWLHLLTLFQSQQKRSVFTSGRILFGIDGRVLWARSIRVNLNHGKEM